MSRCIVFGFLLTALPLRAEVVRLDELEKRAVSARANVAVERARIGAASARVALSRAPLYPTVGASAQVDAAPGGQLIRLEQGGEEYLVQGSRTLGADGAFRPELRYGAAVQFSSRLYDFGRTASQVRAAEAELGAARAGMRGAETEIVLEVRAAYLAWLFAHGTRRILSENVEAASALRQAVEGRVAEGTRPAAELAAVRHDEARARLELARGDGELAAARLGLERASGGPLVANAEPDAALLDSAARAASPAEAQRTRAIEQQRDAALATARAHRRTRAPVLTAVGEAGVRGQGGEFFPAYRVGVALSVPIFDAGVSSASAELATAQADELTARAAEARSRASFERASAEAERAAAEQRLRFATELATAARDGLRHAEDQRELAGGSYEAVIQARVQSAEAELEVLSARVARAEAALRLSNVSSP